MDAFGLLVLTCMFGQLNKPIPVSGIEHPYTCIPSIGEWFMKFVSRFAALAGASLACLAVQPAFAQQGLFRMQNVGLGPALSLDLGNLPGVSQLVAMALPTAQPLGQYWELKGSRTGGDVRLGNLFAGGGKCLDTDGDGFLYMDGCGLQIGQRWQIRESNGGVELTNSFKPGQCLDHARLGNGMVVPRLLPCNGSPNQRWTISVTGK